MTTFLGPLTLGAQIVPAQSEPPLSIEQKSSGQFTYGWEVEFLAGKNVKENEFATFGDRDTYQEYVGESMVKLKTDKYPYFTPTGVIEPSGHIEFTSLPSSSLAKTFETLRFTQKTIDAHSDLPADDSQEVLSIHIHMRFPRSLIDPVISAKEFKGWVARLSDQVFLWRMLYRDRAFALRYSVLQTRIHPEFLQSKGTVKLITDNYTNIDYGIKNPDYVGNGDKYDLELRGFMYDTDSLEKAAHEVTKALKSPESMLGFYDYQMLTYTPTLTPAHTFNEWLINRGKQPLDEKTTAQLDLYIQNRIYGKEDHAFKKNRPMVSNDRVFVPIVGLEFMPYVTGEERNQILQARENFFEGLSEWLKVTNLNEVVVYQYDKSGTKIDETRSLHKGFYDLFKVWSEQSQIYKIVTNSLFAKNSAAFNFEKELLTDPRFFPFLMDRLHLESARNILRKIDQETFSDFLSGKLSVKPTLTQFQHLFNHLSGDLNLKNEHHFYPYLEIALKNLLEQTQEENENSLAQYIDQFNQFNHNSWSESDCLNVQSKLSDIGVMTKKHLIASFANLNVFLGLKSKKPFSDETLKKMRQFQNQQALDATQYDRAFYYFEERVGWTKEEVEKVKLKFKKLGLTTYQSLVDNIHQLPTLIENYNASRDKKTEIFMLGFKDKTIITLQRVIKAMENLKLI